MRAIGFIVQATHCDITSDCTATTLRFASPPTGIRSAFGYGTLRGASRRTQSGTRDPVQSRQVKPSQAPSRFPYAALRDAARCSRDERLDERLDERSRFACGTNGQAGRTPVRPSGANGGLRPTPGAGRKSNNGSLRRRSAHSCYIALNCLRD